MSVTSLFSKEAWTQVGGYNEQLVHGYEDWEFWINITKHGWNVYGLDEPLFNYRKHGKSMIDSAVKKHAFIVNQIKQLHKELYSPIYINQIKRNRSREKQRNQSPSRAFPFRNNTKK
ncbi:glycosyltransferase family 2 protein [Anaerobacillus sp. CMMVII]|uniref:glycosyltransferase family 2 protein n=1 Tax=Anaerobacillus sp. CMMVII TaxID=2755588 RepID=UPI0037C0A6A2